MKNIHVLPTDEPSRLFNCFGKLGIGDYVATRENIQVTNQHIYITNSEEIKEGDWCFYLNRFGGGNIICQAYKHFDDERMLYDDGTYNRKLGEGITPLNEDCKKIILTTDQDLIKDGVQAIDDDFLEWFIKNTSCEEVEVETFFVPRKTIGNDSNYKIIIPNLEIWKDIPEFEGYYQVSNFGNVKSLSRTILGRGKHNALLKERLLKFSTSTNGYYQVILQKEGFKKIYKVHSLVAICFLNHIPDGTHNVVIDHINEVKKDNRLENLRLIGHRENVSRSMKNNTSTYVGVSWSKNAKKWISQITIEGKTKYLGLFDNEEYANKKYLETLKDL